jgi:membrane-associated phospholipid phosphatase
MTRFLKCIVPLIVFSFIAGPPRISAQPPQPDQTQPATAPPGAQPQNPRPTSRASQPPIPGRDVSWKLLFPNLLSDQEKIWTFPGRLAQGHAWLPTTAILGTAAALMTLDPIEGSYFRRTSTFQEFNNVFTGNATVIGTIAVPAGLYGIGLIRRDSNMQKTALLAGEAVADAEILTTVLKDATRRVRPAGIPFNGNYWDNWFESRGSVLRGNGSFPSGHTIAAFSVATVIARRYGNHRWVPYAAYGMAAIVGFSRLTLSAHFTLDVFMGAALGYSISRFTVLRQ